MKKHRVLPDLTPDQLEMIDGSMLGDGCIAHFRSKPNSNWWFQKGQSVKSISGYDKREYLDWHAQVLKEHSRPIYQNILKGNFPNGKYTDRVYPQYCFRTYPHPVWREVGKRWYATDEQNELIYKPENHRKIKIIPRDLVLTPLMMCIWFMDDGSNYSKDANAHISTNGFSIDEVDYLVERLWTDLGIRAKRRLEWRGAQPIIYIGTEGYKTLMDIISPLVIWECFKYKIDRSQYDKVDHRGEQHGNSKLKEDQVRMMFDLYAKGKSQGEIAEIIGIGKNTVSLILNGKRWKHLGLVKEKPSKSPLNAEQRSAALALLAQGFTQSEVAARYNVTQPTISRLAKISRPQGDHLAQY